MQTHLRPSWAVTCRIETRTLNILQVGSFVPAESAEMGVFDAIFTRMGASDSISTGRSTFLIETQEAADIMHKATARSLVVMDELGRYEYTRLREVWFGKVFQRVMPNAESDTLQCRGTSTHDGTAIAYATLKHLVTNVRCFTLFVTHYQHICQMQNELMDKVKTSAKSTNPFFLLSLSSITLISLYND